ncbi:MAG: ABC transporter substrate-binding protein [Oscillospiraceae bacterium]|nr:ABC transporter substrate-binding protein [Oscillospiraceae bacterium]
MLKKRNIFTILCLLLVIAMTLAACGSETDSTAPPTAEPIATETAPPDTQAEPYDETDTETQDTAEPAPPTRVRPETDRDGYAITLPDEINTIVTIGPATTEILVGLGLADRIIAADRFSAGIPGLDPGVPADFGIMDLDAEFIVNLMPDVVFVAGLARAGGGDDPLFPVSAAGITVIYMPTSVSLEAIMEDIRFMAAVMEVSEIGEGLVAEMQTEIEAFRTIGATIAETRTVYFEVSPAPWMFSFGTGTFINEIIELVGAVNIFADYEGWIPVTDEVLLEANPDVILTSTDFLDDPIAEIMERPGFGAITAVQNGDVFSIDTDSSNRPSQNVVRAMREIAEAVFPEHFG